MSASSTALDLLLARSDVFSLSFGCETIDREIGCILPGSGILELSGEAGCGKTQICLILSLQAQVSPLRGGLDGSVAYISCGEGQFPIRRLSQLAKHYEEKHSIQVQDLLSGVHIEECPNDQKMPEMCRTKRVKLLIIDSLAGLVRLEYQATSAADMRLRTQTLFTIASRLKWLSNIFNICVVVVNQVTASGFDETHSSPRHSGGGGGGGGTAGQEASSVPALGLVWSHCVNSRILLRRDTAAIRGQGGPHLDRDLDLDRGDAEEDCVGSRGRISLVRSRRWMVLLTCPYLPTPRWCGFEIQHSGIVGLEESAGDSGDISPDIPT